MAHAARLSAAMATIVLGSAVVAAEHPAGFPHLYAVDQWTTEHGLPQNSVNAVLRVPDGPLWLSTDGGIARFDGRRFETFDRPWPEGTLRDVANALLPDGRAMWVATNRDGLLRFDGRRFTRMWRATALEGDGAGEALALARQRDGTIWAAIKHHGLLRVKDGQISLLNERLPSPVVQDVLVDADDAVWVASDAGLVRLENGRARLFAEDRGLPPGGVHALHQDAAGRLWVGASGGVFEWRGGRFVRHGPAGIVSAPVRALAEGGDGTMWLGTQDGLYRLRGEDIVSDEALGPVRRARINDLFFDQDASLWIATEGEGLYRLRVLPARHFGAADGLPNSTVAVLETRDGRLLTGTWSRVYAYDAGRFALFHRRRDEQPWHNVWSLCETRDGSLWIGMSGGGLTRLRDGEAEILTSAEDGLPSDYVNALYEDAAGALWIGTPNGLARLQGDDLVSYDSGDGLVHDEVLFITGDHAGGVWVGTRGGLAHFRNGRFSGYTTADGLPNDQVRAVHVAKDGAVWIGTYGGGLARLKDGRFATITTREGLFDNTVSRLIDDGEGRLWMSGNRGVSWVRLEELTAVADGRAAVVHATSYGSSEGLARTEANGGGQPAGWQAANGVLWFGAQDGLIAVDPSLPPRAPPAFLEALLVDGRAVEWKDEGRMRPVRGDLEWRYGALDLVAPEKLRFRYRLDGYDQRWIDAGGGRVAHYTNLPPATYRFRVQALAADGSWGPEWQSPAVRLAPAWYQTWWAAAAFGLVAVLGVRGAHRWRVRHLTRRTAELERKVAARTAEIMSSRQKIERAHAELGRAHEDLLATLDRLRLGALLLDADDRVRFLNRAAVDVVGATAAEASGRAWLELLPIGGDDRSRLEAMRVKPACDRENVLVRMGEQTGAGRSYWVDVEVSDDPRDAARRIVLLYDVAEIYDLRALLDAKAHQFGLVGRSAVIQIIRKQIRGVASADTTVLVEGETGTGKELVARAIHEHGPRRAKPLVAVNCAALSESLVASQLFGHRRGAFTGAVSDHDGFFEHAHGGTIFLDEIGDLPLSVQASLLRVLQEGEVTRVGESMPRKVDVRVIAATHRDLTAEARAGRFRQDLLYRIRIARIRLPPLRERREDIPLLAAWFVSRIRVPRGRGVRDIRQRRHDGAGRVHLARQCAGAQERDRERGARRERAAHPTVRPAA